MNEVKVRLNFINGTLLKWGTVPVRDGELPQVILEGDNVWLLHKPGGKYGLPSYRRCTHVRLGEKDFAWPG